MNERMSIQSDIYDAQLREIPHYRHYPEMMAFVGERYGADCERLLVIGESHYLPVKSTIHIDDNRWYEASTHDLTEVEQGWINTRGILVNGKEQGKWKSRAFIIYRRIEDVLVDAGLARSEPTENMFRCIAYMNCFQRPAKQGGSMRYQATDRDILESGNTIKAVVDIIKPKLTCFASTCAWEVVGCRLNLKGIEVGHTCHPSCAWWNRASKLGAGKQIMLSFLRENLGQRTLTPS